MADSTEGTGEAQISFKVKTTGDGKHDITMSESATVLDLKTKLAGEDYENIAVDRQRLIYSGRVMKNDDALSSYKIKAGNTIHMVKSAASNPTQPPSNPTAPTPQAVPSNMAAGTSANNLLAGLTGARFAGHAPLPNQNIFGPDGGMNIPSEDELSNMLNNPQIQATMTEALNNPQFIDMMMQMNPQLRDMPFAREFLQSPHFRQMMTDPEALRSAARMRSMLQGGQGGSLFPAPGATDSTPTGAPASGAQGADSGAGAQAQNPFAAFPPGLFGAPAGGAGAGAGGTGAANPFLSLFGGAPPAAGGAAGTSPAPSNNNDQTTSSTGQAQAGGNAPANPFAGMFGGAGGQFPQMTPEQMQRAMQALGLGGGFGGGPFGGAPAAPADNRPPEERYADQLRQLNDMGFYDFDRNVAALRRSGGSVQGAIQHLLDG